VRIGPEIGTHEVGDLARVAAQLDQVGSVDLPKVSPGASPVNAKQRVEGLERAAMDVEDIRQ